MSTKVYVLARYMPFEGGTVMAVLSSLRKAETEQRKATRLWPGDYIVVDEYELDKVPE